MTVNAMIRKNVFIMMFVFFVSYAFSQKAIFMYEDPYLPALRIVGIPGYDYANVKAKEPGYVMYIEDSVFVNKLIDRINKLIPDTTAEVLGSVTKQLICIKSDSSGYDVLSSYGRGYSKYPPEMELNGKPMKLDRKLIYLLDEIAKIHKDIGQPRNFPKKRIKELYRKEFW